MTAKEKRERYHSDPKFRAKILKAVYQWNTKNKERVKVSRKTWKQNDLQRYFCKRAKDNSARSGAIFDLKKEDIVINEFCPILGIKLNYQVSGYMQPDSPSIDRIIPSLGYVKGNVQIISWKANRIKSDSTPEELKKVSDYMQRFNGAI